MNQESDTYFVTLGTIEYCKISSFEDILFKNETSSQYYDSNLELDKWYIKKYVAKIDSYNGESVTTSYVSSTGGLDNGATVYYGLITPTDVLLGDTLQTQLDIIYEYCKSFEGQTNVLQYNDGLPFILSINALKKGSDTITVNNTGNIYSKPSLLIEGTGTISVYLNDIQIFNIDLSQSSKIMIDTANLEAYDPDTNLLMNRKVTGDYNNFVLQAGNNNIRFSGNLTSAILTNYTRWL